MRCRGTGGRFTRCRVRRILRRRRHGTAPAWGTVTQLNVSSYKTMDACPPLEHMECIECDADSGYYPMVYAGEFSIEGIKHTGTGLSCYYIEICKDDDSCDTSITFKDLGTLFGIYILVFVVLMLLFVLLRKVSWLEMAIDSAAWLEKGNPKFPPRDIPVPKSRKTHALSWLVDAWYRDNDWMKEFTTPDEYMLVRWFKLSSGSSSAPGVLCCPLLMNLYGADLFPPNKPALESSIVWKRRVYPSTRCSTREPNRRLRLRLS